jgi:hypothetical protein
MLRKLWDLGIFLLQSDYNQEPAIMIEVQCQIWCVTYLNNEFLYERTYIDLKVLLRKVHHVRDFYYILFCNNIDGKMIINDLDNTHLAYFFGLAKIYKLGFPWDALEVRPIGLRHKIPSVIYRIGFIISSDS